MDPKFIGTHSMRKGAVAFTSITSAPSITSIYNRANWRMPGVINTYIQHEDNDSHSSRQDVTV
jgi:hypothetical protein